MSKEKILAKIEIRSKTLNKKNTPQKNKYNGFLDPMGGNRYIIYIDSEREASSQLRTLFHEYCHLVIRILMNLWLDGKKLKFLSRLIDKPLSKEELICESVTRASYGAIKKSLERIKK